MKFPADAVVGVMQRLRDGIVVETQVINDPGAPANLDVLLESGASDEEGLVYTDVAGAYSNDGIEEIRYQYIARRRDSWLSPSERPFKPGGTTVVPSGAPSKLSSEVESRMATADPSSLVEIYARLSQPFTTSIKTNSALGFVSLAEAEQQTAAKQERIAARKSEAAALQKSFIERLQQLGARDIAGYWSSNGVAATVPVGALRALADHPDVDEISLPTLAYDLSTTDWDGDDMKASGGINAGAYHDKGFHGQAYTDNPGGRYMNIAVIGDGFDIDHPGLRDCSGCGFRDVAYQCDTLPCSPGQDVPNNHAVKVAGFAAGSIRQNQIGGYTDQQELERTGITEESVIWLISIAGNSNSVKAAIELGMANDVDVMVSATGLGGTACDGIVGSDVEDTIYAAQQQSLIFVQAAGNSGDPGSCNIVGMAEAASTFAVGGLGSSSSACTKDNYSGCNIWSGSSRGGMTATVGGIPFPGAISLVDVLTDACPLYGFKGDGTIYEPGSGACGTSYAAPQVGGTGILVKDWFMDQGYFTIETEGRLYAVMLAMSDRAYGSGLYDNSGFHPRWGGGRFQARFHDSADMVAPFAWETYSSVLTAGQIGNHSMYPPGPSSSGLNQLKVYAMFFEDEPTDIADIDLYVLDQDCGPGALTWGQDASRDVKSMVRLGTEARSKDICIRLQAGYVPPSQSRRVHVYAYYSAGTSMR